MVKVKLIGDGYSSLGLDFEFADCEVAGKFLDVAMAAAVGNVKAEVEKVVEPKTKPTLEEIVDESRFVEFQEDMF